MRFLLDTNILIPAEPTSTIDVEPTTPTVTMLIGLISAAGFSASVHPASLQELRGDHNTARRELRRQLLEKYERLASPPTVPSAIHQMLGAPQPGTNDAVDNELIAAVERNAVNYLVTNDGGIHKKFAKIGLPRRVLFPSDAVALIRGLIPQESTPPPSVHRGKCYELNKEDPIFDSLRADYPGFDAWLEMCQLDHREVFFIDGERGVAAIAIIKDESTGDDRALKICCFKVSRDSRGLKYGELLLKAVLDYCIQHGFDQTYCTCFPKQTQLLAMLKDFGFAAETVGDTEELSVEKHLKPLPSALPLSPLDLHIQFGPATIGATSDIYVIPIEPRYHRMLFPDKERQQSFFAGETPFGNSIRKAYLCHSPMREIPPGSILLFYRSGDYRNIQTVGIAESSIRTNKPNEIIEFVSQRTVYTKAEIEEMTKSETLAILFRYATKDVRLQFQELIENQCLLGVPQSITRIKPEGVEWIHQQLGV